MKRGEEERKRWKKGRKEEMEEGRKDGDGRGTSRE